MGKPPVGKPPADTSKPESSFSIHTGDSTITYQSGCEIEEFGYPRMRKPNDLNWWLKNKQNGGYTLEECARECKVGSYVRKQINNIDDPTFVYSSNDSNCLCRDGTSTNDIAKSSWSKNKNVKLYKYKNIDLCCNDECKQKALSYFS